MKTAKVFGSKNMIIGEVQNELFGSFIEHLGRAVYTGIYEPGHEMADENGFREDVIDLIHELKVPTVRYPGGNFVSGYNWHDGIGPKENRPRRLDLAWRTTESNQFGTDEFMKWAKKANLEPMMAVNLGTGTPQDAAYLVEYCNHPGGTYYSDLRKKYGSEDPYKIRYWCLGNEMDGPWQICQLNAVDYAKKAKEAAKMMKWVDRDIKLVAVGSSTTDLPTYPEWDRIVLENLYDYVDFVSMHKYYWDEGNDNDFLASFYEMDQFIHTIKSTADYVKAKKRSNKTMYISFDEWNVWYQKAYVLEDWNEAPHILEDVYSLKDALVVGGLLNTLLKNCDRVKMASLAQLVNVIAPIMTKKGGEAIKQTIFYPFMLVSNYGRGKVLNIITETDTFSSKYGDAPTVYPMVVDVEEDQSISIFVLNANQEEDVTLELDLQSFGNLSPIEHQILDGDDLEARNTFQNPNLVTMRQGELPTIKDGHISAVLPKLSWSMIRLSYK